MSTEAMHQDNIDFLKEEIELLTDALDHIARTAAASRTSTRRLRWIEQRAMWAIEGKPYDDSAFDLPKQAQSAEKLGIKLKEATRNQEALIKAALDAAAEVCETAQFSKAPDSASETERRLYEILAGACQHTAEALERAIRQITPQQVMERMK